MKKKLFGIATVAALVLLAGTTSAATRSPASGDWKGRLKGVSPATSLSFSVSGSGHGKRTVTLFQSSGLFKAKCAHAGDTSISGIPAATVSSAGKFRAVGSQDNGFGLESWTVAGTFKSKHAASGTVAINLAITSTKRCKFTVPWSASVEQPGHPGRGATYKGKETSGKPVTLKVSSSGKRLSSVSWQAPLVGDCPGAGNESPTFTAHNVAIHSSKFDVTIVKGKGTSDSHTESISGEFLSGRKATGTVSTFSNIKSIGKTCIGKETWTASAH